MTFANYLTRTLLKRQVLFAGILLVFSCDFPSAPPAERTEGIYLTVNFLGARNAHSGLSRSVLPDSFIGTLKYKVTFTGPGGAVIEETVEGGSINIFLDAGDWIITAEAYDPNDKEGTLVGSGEAEATLVAGQYQSVTILMYVDSDYEAGLTEIYIHNEAELRRIGAAENGLAINNPARTFYLMNDITLTQPWTPIGNDDTPFDAGFDGQGYRISIRNGFTAEALAAEYSSGWYNTIGFFGSTGINARIQNLRLAYDPVDATITSGARYGYAGGLAGRVDGSTVSDVTVTGSLKFTSPANMFNVGGIFGAAGISGTSSIKKSSFTGTVSGTGTAGHVSVGGILGSSNTTVIEFCYAVGDVEAIGSDYVIRAGGIAGDFDEIIRNCYACANVRAYTDTGSSTAGGIVGTTSLSSGTGTGVFYSYAAGTVEAGNGSIDAGGIVGESDGSTLITGCVVLLDALYGGISANVHTGFGSGYGTMSSNRVWDAITIIQSGITYKEDTANLLSSYTLDPNKDIASFTTASTYTEAPIPVRTAYPGWNFTDGTGDWKFISGYDFPVLSWQTSPPDLSFVQDGTGIGIVWP